MYLEVYREVKKEFGNDAEVIKKSRAIQLVFNQYRDPVYFDIVPGREIDDFHKTGDLNLYVVPEWFLDSGSRFKTNVQLQKELPVSFYNVRETIRLIKIYRDSIGYTIPGALIEQVVCWAFTARIAAPQKSKLTNFIRSLNLLAESINNGYFPDWSNTNSNLVYAISRDYRDLLYARLISDIEEVRNKPRFLKEIFE